jgi:pimeloyl-ACP methyl ester carboxylesterase
MTLRLASWRSPEGRAEYVTTYDAALSLWTVPYESRTFETRFGDTHAVVSGPEDAPPLVLLPAAVGIGAIQWFRNAARLSLDHRIYALDFVGAPGKGTQTSAISTPADCADWLADLFNAIGIERADIAGSSQGGWFALNLAIHLPDRTGDLVLLGPAASLLPMRKRVVVSIRLGPHMPTWTAALAIKAVFGGRYEVDERILELAAMGLKHFRFQQAALFPGVFAEDELRRLKTRTLVLLGEEEIIYDPHAALARARDLIPDVEAELVPNSGHLLNVEQAELVDSRILGFLKKKAR